LKTKKLYTAAELAEVLGITKSSVHAAMRERRILQPAYQVGQVYGWTSNQVTQIKKDREEMLMKLMDSHIESRSRR
jgi:hypothetical protein